MKSNKNVIITVMCIFAMLLVVGYAAFSTILNVSGTAEISSTWDIHFSNMTSGTAVGNATNRTAPTFTNNAATMDVNLDVPGDSMTYTLTVTNNGSINAIIESIEVKESGSSAIVYAISGLEKGDKLLKGQSDTITVKIEYDKSVTSQPSDTTKKVIVVINAVQDIGQTIS